MPPIYHLIRAGSWNSTAKSPYSAKSLVVEGFIHCSFSNQLARSANRYFADEPELFALEIDADRLSSPFVCEDGGKGELFPHVYGPIDRGAIVAIRQLTRDASAKWIWPNDEAGS
jgi:uncharacterized protein (DUF952 family)